MRMMSGLMTIAFIGMVVDKYDAFSCWTSLLDFLLFLHQFSHDFTGVRIGTDYRPEPSTARLQT